MTASSNWRDFSRRMISRLADRSYVCLRNTPRALTKFGRVAVEFLYPPACRLCSAELPAQGDQTDPQVFCETCLAGLQAEAGPSCLQCGAPIGPYIDPNQPCIHCRGESFAFQSVVRLGTYDAQLKHAVLAGKQRGGEGVVAGLADLVWRRNVQMLLSSAIDVVIPVPLNRWQAVFRSHNPAEELATSWGRRLKIPVATHILRKTRWTEAQARLPPTQRRVNVNDAFAVAEGALPAGATVLLADDVLTTGSTAHEAARALKRSGAARVIVGVVARGLGRRS